MYDNDGRGRLPDANEVILCSKDVSLEQVIDLRISNSS